MFPIEQIYPAVSGKTTRTAGCSDQDNIADAGLIELSQVYKTKENYELFLTKNYVFTVHATGNLKLTATKNFINNKKNIVQVYIFNDDITDFKKSVIKKIDELKEINSSYEFSELNLRSKSRYEILTNKVHNVLVTSTAS